jgi:hypothetical protein
MAFSGEGDKGRYTERLVSPDSGRGTDKSEVIHFDVQSVEVAFHARSTQTCMEVVGLYPTSLIEDVVDEQVHAELSKRQ